MDFRLAEKLIARRFQLRDRIYPDEIVDFRPNPIQHDFFGLCQYLLEQKRPLRIICVKNRRVGFSCAVEGLAACFMFAYPNYEGRVMAHLGETADAILSSAALMAYGDGTPGKGLPWSGHHDSWDSTYDYKSVTIPHRNQRGLMAASRLVNASAKVRAKARGMGFSFAHLSEVAYYPVDAPFTAVLPGLARAPDRSFAVLESTGNGQIGEGEAFYQYWLMASERDKRGDSEWVRFFVPWSKDSYCVSNQVPTDIPRDDEEKVLLKIGLSKPQIAWRRFEIAGNYKGIVEDFAAENPLEPNDAFVTGGFPAFSHEEREYIMSTVRPPVVTGELERTRDPWVVRLASMGTERGRIKIWELPQPRMEYYLGADLARAQEQSGGKLVGDFAAITVFNGSTGQQAASFCARIDPAKMAEIIDLMGRYYRTPEISPQHCAYLNIEMNANLGSECQRQLRDRYAYPHWRFARWRGGKDDRYHRKPGTAIGWETTGHSRNLMFAAFRSSVHDKQVIVRDAEFAQQICSATMGDARWEVMHGHDDVLVSGLLAWITRQQFPPRLLLPVQAVPYEPRALGEFEVAKVFPLIDSLARSDMDEMTKYQFPELGESREAWKKRIGNQTAANRRDVLQGVLDLGTTLG